MKKFFKFLGIIIVLAIVFILVAGLFVSKDYHFERSITINAPRAIVWNNISQFSNFEKWDPWSAYDPNMQRTISGTDGTPGATYTWKGNKDVGSGSQTFKAFKPMEHVDIDMVFKEPFESKAQVFYHLQDEGNAIKLTWGFNSKFPYPMNAISKLFMDMDGYMDKDFTKGLNNLKKLCESTTTMTALNQ
jgi:hypothetical protein